MTLCRYFTHYGNGGVPGECTEVATLRLNTQPDICVCAMHAERICFRFPALGTVEQRFRAIRHDLGRVK